MDHPPFDTSSEFDAPEGGWGWLVVFGSFILQGLSMGGAYTFGVIYVELLKIYGSNEATTSLVGSIQVFLLYIIGDCYTGDDIGDYIIGDYIMGAYIMVDYNLGDYIIGDYIIGDNTGDFILVII